MKPHRGAAPGASRVTQDSSARRVSGAGECGFFSGSPSCPIVFYSSGGNSCFWARGSRKIGTTTASRVRRLASLRVPGATITVAVHTAGNGVEPERKGYH